VTQTQDRSTERKGNESIPISWTWTTLSEIGDVASGGTPKTKDPSNFDGDVSWITPADLSGYCKKTITAGRRNISRKGLNSSSARLLPQGTVLFSSRAPVGYVAIAANPVATNQGFKSLIPHEGVFNEYVYYYLKGSKQLAESYASGTTFRELSASAFGTLPIPLPPTNEQRRIVEKIEELFTKLDAGVRSLKQTQALLKQYRQSVLKAAVNGELSREWREEHPDAEDASALLKRTLEERRAMWEEAQLAKYAEAGKTPPKGWRSKYKEPSPLDTTGLPELPEKWCWAYVEQLTPATRPCAYGVLQPGPDVADGVALVRVGDIENGRVHLEAMKHVAPDIAQKYPRTTLSGGEVLITLVGSIGRTAVVPDSLAGANTARAVGVIPLTEAVAASWVEVWFRNPAKMQEMIDRAHEVARKTLNLEDVRAATVAIPPLIEQQEIVSEVERRLSVIEGVEAQVETNLRRAAGLRLSILKSAFAGTLVPQDPNDEPARVLLERIKEGKVQRQVNGKRRENSNSEEPDTENQARLF
jgi:type I restriction enzyme S subunit